MSLEIKIKAICEKKGVSLNDLANKIDMSLQNLYKIFKRDSIETKHLEKIAEVFGVKVSYFFDEGDLGDGPQVTKQIHNGNGHNVAHSTIKDCEQEIKELQREISRLKDKIIEMLEERK